MKKYIASAFVFTLLFGSAAAFATPVVDTVNSTGPIYGDYTGTIGAGATGTDAILDFNSAVYGDAFVIDFTNASGVITDTLFSLGGDDLEFDGALSGNASIGTICAASSLTACVINTGDVMDLTSTIASINGEGIFQGDLTAQATDALAPVPEPSSLLLLGTGIFGVCGVARRRFARTV